MRPVPPRSLRIEARGGESHRSQLDLEAFRPFLMHRYSCHVSALYVAPGMIHSGPLAEIDSPHSIRELRQSRVDTFGRRRTGNGLMRGSTFFECISQ